MKAGSAIKQILNEINVRETEAPLEADEVQDTMLAINNYMFALDADGVSLGFTEIDSVNDVITIPNGALLGMIYNVAMLMATTFGVPVSQDLAMKASRFEKVMTKLGATITPTAFPSTLPVGSGNRDGGIFTDDYFYPGLDSSVENEQGGAIGLESSTND